ncbi:phosphatidylinositol 3,4,5-trisphosphate 5-phosphatase 2B-like isoform X1 [Hyperolius riggenbachi]|uniref:phosphatidylinositol 3,4,5-trisphosphate 5-phosphatase 2B-like isoform X1 n=1 Tax=Hyperolius riggenbachi TaxID=752182 RepID=UPI0035A2F5EC
MCDCWYHAELSQASAEQLLIRDGRDGAFLVRQSESVSGAYAICLMYQQQVHTYRVLPEENGLLAVQAVQGIEVRRFSGLCKLVSAYRRKGNGLVTALCHPIGRERLGKNEQTYDDVRKCSCWKDNTSADSKRLLSPRGASKSIRTPVLQKDCSLSADSAELEEECLRLDREMKSTWSSLRTLAQLFGYVSATFSPDNDQMSPVDKLIDNMSDVLQLLSGLENKVTQMFQGFVAESSFSSAAQPVSPKLPVTRSSEKASRRNEQVIQNDLLRRSIPQNLSVFIGTWNMGGTSPPYSLISWIAGKNNGTSDDPGSCEPCDLYMIGSQENPQGDREWAEFLRTTLISYTSKNYKVVCTHSVGGIKLVILVKEQYELLISRVQISTVKTRISNTLGMRGAVGASFDFNGTPLGFVTSHLISGVDKVQKRNQSYGEILRGLALGDEALRGFQLPLRLVYLFWAGDLNYKLDMPVQDVLQCVYSGQQQLLLPVDQLNQERERKKVFVGFKEEPITFPPTCRYERGSRTYDLQKTKTSGTRIFAPSWSDRILWTSYPDMEVKCSSYGCNDDIMTSDHAPVFGTFEIKMFFIPKKDASYTLKFVNIESIVKTQSRSRAYIDFKSLCLKDSPQSKVNSTHSAEGNSFLKLGWSEEELPEIKLVAGNTFTGHLLLSIRPADGSETFGECCVSVIAANGNTDHQFQAFLSQRGEEIGSLRGRVRLTQYDVAISKKSPSMSSREAEEENPTKANIPVSPVVPPTSQSSKRLARRRPASICCGSYSNAEYFLFEGLNSPSTPTSPRPRSALVSGDQRLEPGESPLNTELGRILAPTRYRRNTCRTLATQMPL